MNVSVPAVTLGWVIALIVLVVCVVLFFIGGPISHLALALIAALAVARLT